MCVNCQRVLIWIDGLCCRCFFIRLADRETSTPYADVRRRVLEVIAVEEQLKEMGVVQGSGKLVINGKVYEVEA